MAAVAPPPAQLPTGPTPNPPRPSSSLSNKTDSRRTSTDPKVVVVEPSAQPQDEDVKREDGEHQLTPISLSTFTLSPAPIILHDGFLSPAPTFPIDGLNIQLAPQSRAPSPAALPFSSVFDFDEIGEIDEYVDSVNSAKSPKAKSDNPQRPPARPHSAAKSKFDLEPNPFDLSFQSHRSNSAERTTPPRGTDATSIKHNALPPLSSLTSPAATNPNQFPWLATQSLRTGPLSPAMLAGPQQHNNNVTNQNGVGSLRTQNQEGGHQEGGAFDSNTFRTGFTPGTGSGFTPGYTSLMGGNFASSLPMPSPNTAAFLNMVTNSTPLGEGGAGADGQQQVNAQNQTNDGSAHPPSAIPPHMQQQHQQHHGLSHLHPQHSDVPQETITPGTLSALTGVFNDMNRAQQAGPNGPHHPQQYFPQPGMHPGGPHAAHPHPPGLPPHGAPGPGGVDYAQQSANAASQAANGLFLLSQAHQELSKREEQDTRGTPVLGKSQNSSKSINGLANVSNGAGTGGQKRKSDAGPPKAQGPPAKKGKKHTPEKLSKAESASPNFSMSGDEDDDENKSGKPETEEEKRKNFLERNRQAALKCRQRKKAWLNELQQKVEQLTVENERLQQTIGGLHDEVGRLSTILMQHRDCGLGIPTGYGRPIR